MTFTVPLVSASRVFGDVLIEVEGQDTVSVEAASLRSELVEVLNLAGVAALDQATGSRAFLSPIDLRSAGFDLNFSSARLELSVVSIRPDYLQVQRLGGDSSSDRRINLRTLEPARFSTYLNFTGNLDYSTRSGNEAPDIFLDGATRIGGIVVEYEAALTDQFSGDYEFFRRNTRIIYDDPNSYRRYSAGDLRLNNLSILRNPQIGGVAIEKSRQIFDPSFAVARLGGRQIFLDNRSTVDVLINGSEFNSFQLDAGTYDLASLPIQQGSNDIQLRIRDSFGQEQTIDYNFFFEPLELAPGEEEYSLGVGVLADGLSFQPSYTEDIAATGFYRRALSENLILGGAFQASKDVQVLGGSMSVVPQWLPGIFDLEAAASTSENGNGVALRAGYQYRGGNPLSGTSQISVNVDYESKGFNTIDNVLPINFDLLSVSATYSRSFSLNTFATVGGSYVSSSARPKDDYTVFVDVNHRVSERLRLNVGAEYGLASVFRRSFGVRAGLTLALGGRTRASADYNSRIDSLRANLSRGADNNIGSFGYDIGISKFGDDTQADVQLDYASNRFDARADFSSSGPSFGSVFDDQRARLQVGTSIAFADGTLGVGRPINNSFLLAKPHPALQEQGIVTARTLSGGDHYARSGTFGAAVQGDLSPYNEQSVQFDAADPADGFDVGDGTVRVDPPYKSGYQLNIGSEHYVSLIGNLEDADGPIALATGRVTAVDEEEDFDGLAFFTNSKGRFGLFGLAPGKSYEVTLTATRRKFLIEVPENSEAVIRIDQIKIPSAE